MEIRDWALLNETVTRLEYNQNDQKQVDEAYSGFCNILKEQMNTPLKRMIVVVGRNNNKKRRIKKPWWSEELSGLWNDMCKSEKEWIKCPSNNQQRKHLKQIFIEKRKVFDKVVQRSKRRHWKEMQEELLNSCKSNSKDFWKKIGRIGVGEERNSSIPMETETPDGIILVSKQKMY